MLYTPQEYIDCLQQNSTESESHIEETCMGQLEDIRQTFQGEYISQQNLLKFQLARTVASESLRRDKLERERWDSAQLLMGQWVEDAVEISEDEIYELNNVVSGSGLRDTRVFAGGEQHPEPDVAKELMEYFLDHIWEKEAEYHPVFFAHLVKMWLVSIHPFSNGNGRTAQLCADYILLKNGYLPHSFSSKVMAMCVCLPGKISTTPHRVCLKMIKSVQHSYQLLNHR